MAYGQDYEKIHRELKGAATPEAKREVLNRAAAADEHLRVTDLGQVTSKQEYVAGEAVAQRLAKPMKESLAAEAKSVREGNPFYREREDREASNWVKRSMENLIELIKRLMPKPPERNPNVRTPNFTFDWLVPILWFLLAVVVALGLIFVFAQVKLNTERRLRAASMALMDEEEPDRTLDEWLQQADRLEAEGKYREAVRALFLASLMKIDEAGVARFNRRQTNWEHLHRIEASPSRPHELDFRRPTKEFDRIWYGYEVRGASDVAMFRELYTWLRDRLGRSG